MIPTSLTLLIAASAISFPYAVAATPNDKSKMPLQARDNPKLNEYSGENCDGTLLYHHSPPAEQCVGIDQQTKSVYLVNGFGESNLMQAFLNAGECDHGQGGAVLTWDVDRENCFRVERPGEGSGRVRDVMSPIA